ncbi:MAG: DUF4330 domain-containing protein [Gracilibacteraceae bacterium]|jgi:hypothetical protein|nr:DUF4330 domain-containing protein [Gracilibacteraceae bacterium]
MLLDEKGRLFGKISIVDIGVLLLIAVLIGGVYYKFFMVDKDQNAAKFDTIEYKVLVEEVRQQSVDAMEIGADIYDAKTDSPMGRIEDIEVLPATGQLTKADGTVVIAEKPERFNVLITIKVPGIETKYGFRANGRLDINRESQQVLDTRMIEVVAKIVDVKNLSKGQ